MDAEKHEPGRAKRDGAGLDGLTAEAVARAEFARLTQSDLGQVLELERACFSTPWNEKQFNLALQQKIFHLFGLKANGDLLAYMAFYHAADEMEILNIGVAPAHRRRGAGRRLLGLVLGIARRMGVRRAFLEVRRSNAPARTLYAGFGFEHAGVRAGYYTDTGEDALVLCRDLDGEVAFDARRAAGAQPSAATSENETAGAGRPPAGQRHNPPAKEPIP
ncbi:MAG: ribosomal protein S18-alanine N-acetyltransferase [Desulfovibrionaceae bacterium]|jgi:ribosomal-protein-alanine N-acetyltransferase|nr:ribosomal protein S18-alanine N-acetyltransferase [Desulfovibrionaceae bacterium]